MKNRDLYINEVIDYIDLPVVKIIKGVRRSGKSELLKLVIEELKKREIPDDRIVYINYEYMSSNKYRDYNALYEYVESIVKKTTETVYVFLDEIQEVNSWEMAVRSMRAELKCDVYITGSNANLLSKEMATLISGRYVEFDLYPLSFAEYLDFYEIEEINRQDAFLKYIQFGGFPGLVDITSKESIITKYLKGIYDSVVLNDVIERNNIRNPEPLKRIFAFLLDNIGQLTSPKGVFNYLKGANGEKISLATIYNYIDAFEQALLLYSAKPYDIKGKKIMTRSEKYYVADIGLKHALLGYRSNDIGQVLENIIFLELKRKGYQVFVGRTGEWEVDFVAKKEDITLYIQVSYLLATADVVEREFRSLEAIDDNFPKYVLSMDKVPFGNKKGIKWMNLIDFLLSDEA